MILFNSNKKIETAFKNSTLCHIDKGEGEIISQGMMEIFKQLEPFKEKLDYISQKINENPQNVLIIAMFMYPDLSIKEAINKLYEGIKQIDKKFNSLEEKPIKKSIRTKKEIEDIIAQAGLAKTFVAKAYYLKESIKTANECAFF